MTQSRKLAFEILERCEKNGAYSNIMLQKSFDKTELDTIDKAFVTNLVYGVLSRKLILDFYIANLYKRDVNKLDRKVVVILRMGLYQIEYMDRVPDSATVNESVELCKRYVNIGAAGLVNGVLRAFLRQERIVPDEKNIRYSCDESIVSLLESQYGAELTDKILEASFIPRRLCVSVNTLKVSTEEFCNKYGAVCLTDGCCETDGSVLHSDGFDSGEFFVQDASSQEAVSMLFPIPGDCVADLCAAPGGKTLKAAILMKNTGRILAFDIHGNKLSLVKKSCIRLGINIVETLESDARILNKKLVNAMDKVICDVPCSGLGVMSKKPEIRYKKTEEFEGLYPLQQAILRNASEYIKVGGRILYSTCTINKYENERQVKRFLAETDCFKLIDEKTFLPLGGNDGFYAAVIERVK